MKGEIDNLFVKKIKWKFPDRVRGIGTTSLSMENFVKENGIVISTSKERSFWTRHCPLSLSVEGWLEIGKVIIPIKNLGPIIAVQEFHNSIMSLQCYVLPKPDTPKLQPACNIINMWEVHVAVLWDCPRPHHSPLLEWLSFFFFDFTSLSLLVLTCLTFVWAVSFSSLNYRL